MKRKLLCSRVALFSVVISLVSVYPAHSGLVNLSPCPPGQGRNEDGKCDPCEEGMFSSESRCFPCTNCPLAHLLTKYQCRPELNAVCKEECEEGFYRDLSSGPCNPCEENANHEKCVKDREKKKALMMQEKNRTSCNCSVEASYHSDHTPTDAVTTTADHHNGNIVWIVLFSISAVGNCILVVCFIMTFKIKRQRRRSIPFSQPDLLDITKLEAGDKTETGYAQEKEALMNDVTETTTPKQLAAVTSPLPISPKSTLCTACPRTAGLRRKPSFTRSLSAPATSPTDKLQTESKDQMMTARSPTTSSAGSQQMTTGGQVTVRHQQMTASPDMVKRDQSRQYVQTLGSVVDRTSSGSRYMQLHDMRNSSTGTNNSRYNGVSSINPASVSPNPAQSPEGRRRRHETLENEDDRKYKRAIELIKDTLFSELPLVGIRDDLGLLLNKKNFVGEKYFRHVAEVLELGTILRDALQDTDTLFSNLDQMAVTIKAFMEALKKIERKDALKIVVDWVIKEYDELDEEREVTAVQVTDTGDDDESQAVNETGDKKETRAVNCPTDELSKLLPENTTC